ncbi:MAG: SAF domain-containing protein, partial [Pseudomonadota bacterium]
GFEVVCAGKGTKYRPHYHQSTPETVWEYMGFDPEQAVRDGMNPKMFNSFTDGTKSALEMAAIANACGLTPPSDGLLFPPCGVDDLAEILRPAREGGVLERKGMVETVSSEERDGRPVFRDLRWGVYAVFEAPNDYAAGCFRQYGMNTDKSGRYSAMYKPFHLIGMELNVSILSAALLGQATGETAGFRGDVVATAKRDLSAGEVLDGEGGYCVWGKLIPAGASVGRGALPIGLAQDVTLTRNVKKGDVVGYDDVAIGEDDDVAAYRRAMERANA